MRIMKKENEKQKREIKKMRNKGKGKWEIKKKRKWEITKKKMRNNEKGNEK